MRNKSIKKMKKSELGKPLIEAQTTDESEDVQYSGGDPQNASLIAPSELIKIPNMDYQKWDANTSMLYKARKVIASECVVEKPADKDTNIDLILKGLDAFQPLHDPVMRELPSTMAYSDAQFEKDQSNIDKLTFNTLFPVEEGQEEKNVRKIIRERTDELAQGLKSGGKMVKLDYLNCKKNFIQCSNLVEFYDFLDENKKWVFCRLQKVHNAKEHSSRIRITKKVDDVQKAILGGEENYVSHKDVYHNASNIAGIFIGQYFFTLRIEKDGRMHTLLFERWNIITEEKVVVSSTKIELPDKVTADIIKFIHGRDFSASITYVPDDKLEEKTPWDLDVIVIYRNDSKNNNETWGFDIRDLRDLSKVKYKRAQTNKEWIDIGGRKNWRKHGFAAVKYTDSEAAAELGFGKEVVIVCPFQTITLYKVNKDTYQPLTTLPPEKMQILDKLKKTMDLSQGCKYRTVKSEVYTDKLDYNIEIPFFDKDSVVHIFNDHDCRSIQYIEQYVEGSQFKHGKYDLSETIKTDIVKKVGTLTGVNKLIAEMNPWLRYQFIVNRAIKNMVYYTNPANEHGKVNVSCANNILEDKKLQLLKYFKQPIAETQNKTYSIRFHEAVGPDCKLMWLDKCVFFCNISNVKNLEKQVFIKDENGNPCRSAVQFGDDQFNNFTTPSLFILQQKTVYAHDDASVRAFLLIDTAGPYLSETDVKKVWLAFIDIENMECIHYTQVYFKFPPNKLSWLSATEALQFTPSSPLTQSREDGKIVYSQNYHLLCNNAEYSFHEILEYQVKQHLNEVGKIIEVTCDLIGMSTFVTAESFNAGAVMIYTQFDDENEIIGSMLIFGGSVGQKRIYPLTNPSEQNPFQEYFLTSVKQTNFRSRIVGESDISSLTQVRFNSLRMKNKQIFNKWDQQFHLDHSLKVGNNIVPFNFNLIVDNQESDTAVKQTFIYSPNQPLELLHNQNLINMATANSPELKIIMDNIYSTDQKQMPGALDAIMKTYKSMTKEAAFRKQNLLMDNSNLINTLDFNFQGVLAHATMNKTRLAIEYIFQHINEQPASQDNYNLVVMNLEAMLDNNYGNYLDQFLDETSGATTFSVKKVDGKLNPNQCTTFIDYFQFDHDNIKGDQVVDRFRHLIDEKEKDLSDKQKHEERLKVSYNYIDFTPMIFKRKMLALRDAEHKDEQFEEPLLNRGELIEITEQIVCQTDNELHRQAALRVAIDDIFFGRVFTMRKRLLYIILFCQVIPLFTLIFGLYNVYWNVASVVLHGIAVFVVAKEEWAQYQFDKESYFESFWNYNDCFYIVINILQLLVRIIYIDENIIPDWSQSEKGSADCDVNRPLLIINLLVLFSTSMKLVTLLRMFESIGNLIALLDACLRDIAGFLAFMMLFVVTISAFYKLVGARFDDAGYSGVSDVVVYIMQTTRNAIGDISTPQYAYWMNSFDHNPVFSQIMIAIIWLIFYVFNIVILLIVLLNFLIAIVGDSYQYVVQEEVQNIYRFRQIMNKEYIEIYGDDFERRYNHILIMSDAEGSRIQSIPEQLKHIKANLQGSVEDHHAYNRQKLNFIQKQAQETKVELLEKIEGSQKQYEYQQNEIEELVKKTMEALEQKRQRTHQ